MEESQEAKKKNKGSTHKLVKGERGQLKGTYELEGDSQAVKQRQSEREIRRQHNLKRWNSHPDKQSEKGQQRQTT